MSYITMIPARYGSTRFPGKPLSDMAGKPMIQRVYEQVSSGADVTYIVTDDARIQQAAEGFGAPVVMTSAEHPTGTDRLAEAAAQLGLPEDAIVVNVQGDEPFMPVALLDQVAALLSANSWASVATLGTPIREDSDKQNPNIVKVVADDRGRALYFSRAAIPFDRDGDCDLTPLAQRHLGIYAYRAGFLAQYPRLSESPLERFEKLEQLRVLWHGYDIAVANAIAKPGMGIDTPQDLQKAVSMLSEKI